MVRDGEALRRLWLAGFDAPCLHTMVADKPMQGHGLRRASCACPRKGKREAADKGHFHTALLMRTLRAGLSLTGRWRMRFPLRQRWGVEAGHAAEECPGIGLDEQ